MVMHVIGVLILLWQLDACHGILFKNFFAQVDRPQTMPDSFLKVMFWETSDMQHYKRNCGKDWHDMFVAWERQQSRAIRQVKGVKYVIWRCQEHCGGLGDRWRGLLTSFMLALVTNRAFFIDSDNPVPLHHYFGVGNPALHWVFDNNMLRNKSILEEHIVELPSIGDYANANLSLYDKFDVLIQRSTFYQPFNILRNENVHHIVEGYEDHTLAGCVLNYLLVPSKSLQAKVGNMKRQAAKGGKRIVAVQVRTGDGQVKSDSIMSRLVDHFQSCINNITTQLETSTQVFLTTDFVNITRLFERADIDLLTFEGQVFHVDGEFGAPTNIDRAFEKLLLDHLMISHAHHAIISRSGFAELAIMRGFKSYYTPIQCDVKNAIPHYSFPQQNPTSMPSNPDNIDDVLAAYDIV